MVTFILPPRTPDRTSLSCNGDATDIVIKCGGETFSAHKSTVCRQSQTLQDACDTVADVSGLVPGLVFDRPTRS